MKARQVARIQTDSEVAAFVVHDPKISGAQIEADPMCSEPEGMKSSRKPRSSVTR